MCSNYARSISVDPLTTDDAFWHCLTLATCDKLAQFILKIGFVLAKRVGYGEVVGFSMGCCAHGSSLGWL